MSRYSKHSVTFLPVTSESHVQPTVMGEHTRIHGLGLISVVIFGLSQVSYLRGSLTHANLSDKSIDMRRSVRCWPLLARLRTSLGPHRGNLGIRSASLRSSALESSKTSGKVISPPLALGERFSVAPMMDYTDRHFRFLLRMITKKAWLYTEMITSEALIHGDADRLLRYHDPIEHPVALQLGGSDPDSLAKGVKKALPYAYDAINLNCGCPSDKVSGRGSFGAALMKEPDYTAVLCESMIQQAAATDTPVSVKCRIGVDENDDYHYLKQFVTALGDVGVRHFIIHARKAILNMNLSPKQNREIPPLKYQYVHRLVVDFPSYSFVLNGGVKSLEEADEFLKAGVAGVMVGREIINRPWYWGDVDRRLFGVENPRLSRREILGNYSAYAVVEMERDPRLGISTVLKPVQHLFVGERGARAYRRTIAELSAKKVAVDEILKAAINCIGDQDLDQRWP
ncbi:hypothetical protein AAMO2058_000817100 [Amorphochlora amoebiformis]